MDLKLGPDQTGLAGCGGLLRDCHGNWISGFARAIGHTSSLAAELWAIRDGLTRCCHLSLQAVVVEVDASVAVSLLSQDVQTNGEFSSLIDDCRNLMKSIHQVQLKHCFREANRCADAIAKFGNSVLVWGDNWLPTPGCPKVISQGGEGCEKTRVGDFIDQETREWREDLIDRVFFDFEASIIKKIPLCRSIQDDILIWPFNPDGVYSVKSGYRFLQDSRLAHQPSPSNSNPLKQLWKHLWSLDVPNKVKHLIWRACKDALPTKKNLVRRKVVSDSLCEMCKQHEEDTLHALYHCPELQSLWMTTPAWNQDILKQKTCFTDFIVSVFAGLKEPELLMVVLWNLWKRRNNLRLGKPTIPLNRVLEHSREQRFESHSSPLPSTTPRSNQLVTWTPPPEQWYKVNFDGATFADMDKAGLGIVVRNCDGLVMASMAQQIPLPHSVVEVETLAARRALEFALELGFEQIILEGDSETLFKAIKTEGSNFTPYGHLVQDLAFLSDHFSAFKISLLEFFLSKLFLFLLQGEIDQKNEERNVRNSICKNSPESSKRLFLDLGDKTSNFLLFHYFGGCRKCRVREASLSPSISLILMQRKKAFTEASSRAMK
nr:putative ribonuclease h protein [Quercus suber]